MLCLAPVASTSAPVAAGEHLLDKHLQAFIKIVLDTPSYLPLVPFPIKPSSALI